MFDFDLSLMSHDLGHGIGRVHFTGVCRLEGRVDRLVSWPGWWKQAVCMLQPDWSFTLIFGLWNRPLGAG